MSADKYGLDKDARLAAARAAKIIAAVPPPLDPPFPFKAEPFDVDFFRIPPNPVPAPPASV